MVTSCLYLYQFLVHVCTCMQLDCLFIFTFLLHLAPPSSNQNIDNLQAKLQQANDEKAPGQQDVATLQQEENVSISGSNARLMIMKKLSRKAEVS